MSAAASEGLPKRLRLRKRREFLVVQRSGRRVNTAHFIVYGRPNGGRPPRLGITVSRKAGKAHLRNRIKRLVREAFRRHVPELPTGVDLVLVAKNEGPPSGYAEVVEELVYAANRLRPTGAQPPPRRGAERRGGR